VSKICIAIYSFNVCIFIIILFIITLDWKWSLTCSSLYLPMYLVCLYFFLLFSIITSLSITPRSLIKDVRRCQGPWVSINVGEHSRRVISKFIYYITNKSNKFSKLIFLRKLSFQTLRCQNYFFFKNPSNHWSCLRTLELSIPCLSLLKALKWGNFKSCYK